MGLDSTEVLSTHTHTSNLNKQAWKILEKTGFLTTQDSPGLRYTHRMEIQMVRYFVNTFRLLTMVIVKENTERESCSLNPTNVFIIPTGCQAF